MARAVVVNASDDQIYIVQFGMHAGRCEPGQRTDLDARVDRPHAAARDDRLRALKVRLVGGDQPVQVGRVDEVVVEDDEVAEAEVGEGEGDVGAGAPAPTSPTRRVPMAACAPGPSSGI